MLRKCSDLIEALKESIDKMNVGATFREHIFTAHWQQRCFHYLKIGMMPGEICLSNLNNILYFYIMLTVHVEPSLITLMYA